MKNVLKVVSIVAVGATLLLAGPRGEGGAPRGCSLIENLELSDSQRTALRNLAEEMRSNLETQTPSSPLVTATADGSFNADTYITEALGNAETFIRLEATYVESALGVLDDTQRATYLEGLADLNASEIRHCNLMHVPGGRD